MTDTAPLSMHVLDADADAGDGDGEHESSRAAGFRASATRDRGLIGVAELASGRSREARRASGRAARSPRTVPRCVAAGDHSVPVGRIGARAHPGGPRPGCARRGGARSIRLILRCCRTDATSSRRIPALKHPATPARTIADIPFLCGRCVMSERATRAGAGTDQLTLVASADRFGSRRSDGLKTMRTTRTPKTDPSAAVGCHQPRCRASGKSPWPAPPCNRSHPLRARRHG